MTVGDPSRHDESGFLLALTDRLRKPSAPLDVMSTAVEMLGLHLAVSRVGFCDVENADSTFFYPTGWGDGVLQPLAGRLPMAYLGKALIADLRAGEVAVIPDVELDTRPPPGGFAAIGTRAAMGVPLIRDRVWVAGLFVHHATVREWQPFEVALLVQVLERTWNAVELARVEEGRQRLERRQTLLYDLVLQQRYAVHEQDVLGASASVIGRYLDTDRTGFFELPDDDTVVFANCWTAGRLPVLEGSFPAIRIGAAALAKIRDGKIVAFVNAATDEIVAGSVFLDLGALAGIGVPVVRNGRWHAGLYVNHAEPRLWLSDDIAWLHEVVELTWDAVERIRAVTLLAETNASLEKRVEIAKADLQATNASLEQRIEVALRNQATIEEALRQSQKMEAVGQLTGGLAHDFNNLLSGISGSLELMERRVGQGRFDELERYLTVAQGATKRAAALTHRLLAFSRRQTLDPKPTDVNRLIMGMNEMLRRTIGPEIELDVVGSSALWTALIDPSCLVPGSCDANLSRKAEEALWQAFFTAAPAQRREFEPNSKRRKRRRAFSPGAMG